MRLGEAVAWLLEDNLEKEHAEARGRLFFTLQFRNLVSRHSFIWR